MAAKPMLQLIAITLDSDPYVIIRPEGDWDRPGVLDMSAGRPVSSPLRTV